MPTHALIPYLILFLILILFSAFFSSAETALLAISRIKLAHRAKKKNKKAVILAAILDRPEEFLSTVLIGNNLVNAAAASIATYIFSMIFTGHESYILLTSTLSTALILVIFGEITPKSYAYHHAEKLSFLYVYPIRFFKALFFPLVKIFSLISGRFVRRGSDRAWGKREFTIEEIKHFLSNETQLFTYTPENLKMINEIIDISQKELKAIMTPRTAIVALEENSPISELKQILREKKFSKIPIYKENPGNITGIIHPHSLLAALMEEDFDSLQLKRITTKPIFVSEYSSLNYILKEFKKHRLDIGIVLDEYGVTIGLITLSDILRETLGDIEIGAASCIKRLKKNVFVLKGSTPVEEVNSQLEWNLPEKKDFTTVSGLFIYYYGKFPVENARIRIAPYLLIVRKMGKRKIEEITAIHDESHNS